MREVVVRAARVNEVRDVLKDLRRQNWITVVEIKILRRASTYFARENVLLHGDPAGPRAGRGRGSRRGDLQGVFGISRPATPQAAAHADLICVTMTYSSSA